MHKEIGHASLADCCIAYDNDFESLSIGDLLKFSSRVLWSRIILSDKLALSPIILFLRVDTGQIKIIQERLSPYESGWVFERLLRCH